MEYATLRLINFIGRYKQIIIPWSLILGLLLSAIVGMVSIQGGIISFLGLTTLVYMMASHQTRYFVFLTLLLLVENFFYIFNRSTLIFIYDLKQLVGLFLLIMFVFYFPKILKSRFFFSFSLFLFMGYQILSIFTAYFTIGQPILKGVYTLMFPSLILIYFFACFLIEDLKRYEIFKRLLIYTSIGAGIIYVLQAWLYPRMIFLTTDFRFRYGNIRFTEFTVFMLFCAFITLNELMNHSENTRGIRRPLFMAAFVLQMYTFFFIAQSRFITITTVFLFGMAMLCLQKSIPRRTVIFMSVWFSIGASAVLMLLYMQGKLPKLQFLFDTLQEILTLSGNLDIRSDAVKYFIENLHGHWLLGWGSLNLDFPKAFWVSGRRFWHYMVDVGFVGYLYQYGILGCVIAFYVVLKSLQMSWQIYRKSNAVFFPILCNSAILLNSIMVFFFQETMALFYVGLIFAFMEFEYRKTFTDNGGLQT